MKNRLRQNTPEQIKSLYLVALIVLLRSGWEMFPFPFPNLNLPYPLEDCSSAGRWAKNGVGFF